MLYVILMTYHTENLVISMNSCLQFSTEHKLIVHNDNPNEQLPNGIEHVADVINETENQGMLDARIKSLLYIKGHYNITDKDLVLFMDDDDILFDFKIPEFDNAKLMTDCVELTTSAQLINALTNNDKIEQYKSSLNRIPNYTVSGNVYKLKDYLEFIDVFIRYEPEVKHILGTDKVFASEDDILDGCYYHYTHHINKYEHFAIDSKIPAVGWNHVESRVGKYDVDDHCYGEGDSEKRLEEFQDTFNQILNNFIPWYINNYEHK